MRTLLALTIAVLLGLPALARAQASVDIHFGIPVVLPQLVVVSPGIQVVPGIEEEVFFTGGFYWVRRDDVWYRSRTHTGGWVVVPGRGVPPGLARIPPGRYRNWHPGPRPMPAAHHGGPGFRGGPGPAVRGGPGFGPGPGRGEPDRGRHKGHGRH